MITSKFTISTAASATDLTTLDTVKTALGITNNDDDAYFNLLIPQVSAQICTYLGVPRAQDGTVTLGQETVVETFRLTRDEEYLILSRWPVISISQILEDDADAADALEADEYEFNGVTGELWRLDGNDNRIEWCAYKAQITYVAGWVLPGDSGTRTLPQEIEDAAISMISMARSARTRDPFVRSETVEGIGRTDYGFGGTDKGDLPPAIAAKLDPFRNIQIG